MLKDKNAIVTGARRGIGRATILAFAQYHVDTIWACARKQDKSFEEDMMSIAREYHTEIIPVYMDITDEKQVKEAVKAISSSKKRIDILANVAGMADESTSFVMTPMEKMKRVFEANFWGATCFSQYISRLMIRNKAGCIVFVSSVAGIDGEPAQYEYATSKAAINGAVKQLSKELSQYNIRVNTVAPGIIDTDMGSQIEDSLKLRMLEKVSLGRFGKAEEIASVIGFLASDLSSYITGQVIRVDGGM